MNKSQSTLTRIDLVCERFEDQWQSESAPEIKSFLEGFAGQSLKNLFFHLLEIDLDYRSRLDVPKSESEWRNEFPEFSDILDEVFATHAPDYDTLHSLAAGDTGAETDPHDTLASFPHRPTIVSSLQRIGGYQLESVVGRGGMGIVYRARQVSLDRPVALKMIRADGADDEEFLRRFQVEAQLAASLRHPGIVQVFDVGEDEGHHFFSMELVEGESLADLVAQHPLSDQRAAEFALQIAEAMDYAHQHDLVHRDLKPANVLVTASGDAKITDFGLAKTLETDSNLTATGHVLGTPAYMPPEQAIGDLKAIGRPSDVYAVGAILYELLIGRPPFQSPSPYETIFQVLNQEPVAPRRLNSRIRQDLETITLHCLEKEPSKRYESMAVLAQDLKRFLEDRPIQARPVSSFEHAWRWSRRNKTVAALLAAVTLSVLVGLVVSVYFAILAESRIESAQRNEGVAKQQTQQTIQTIEETVELLSNPNIPLEQRERLVLNQLVSSLNDVYRGFEFRNRIDVSMGKTQMFLGDLSLRVGDENGVDATERTIEYYERAVSILEGLYRGMDPDDPDEDLAFYYGTALHNLADIYFAVGKVELAEKSLGRSSQVRKDQLQRRPQDIFVQMGYVSDCQLAAEIAASRNQLDRAVVLVDEALETIEPLTLEGNLDRIQALRIKANVLLKKGHIGLDFAQPFTEEALQEAEATFGLLAKLVPQETEYPWGQSMVYESLGDLEMDRGSIDAAQKHYERSYQLTLQCIEAEPERMDWQTQLVYCLDDQVAVAEALGDIELEVKWRREALVMRRKAVIRDPGNGEIFSELFEDARRLLGRLFAAGEALQAERVMAELREDRQVWAKDVLDRYAAPWKSLEAYYAALAADSTPAAAGPSTRSP